MGYQLLAKSSLSLLIKLKEIKDNLENLPFIAGTTLVSNIRANARKYFGHGQSGYPYEFHNSFQSDDVVYYKDNEKAVFVDHPAAFVLEYGIGEQTIRAKNGEYMYFEGKDGELVAAKEVKIAPKKPTNYAREAIEQTLKDLKNQKRYKGKIV